MVCGCILCGIRPILLELPLCGTTTSGGWMVQDEEAECNTITRGDWKVAFVLLLTMWNGGWMLRLFSY